MKFSLDIKRSEQLANICGSLDKNLENIANNLDAVSYTHLTLPTIYSV